MLEIVINILMVIMFGILPAVLMIGHLFCGTLTEEKFDERTKEERTLLASMENILFIIMSIIVCVSVCINFNTMVCFAILAPVMGRSIKDALCATTLIGKINKYTLMILFSIGLILVFVSFTNETILESNAVRAWIVVSVFSVPVKGFVDMFQGVDSFDGIDEDQKETE